ncbi:hypothetical protein F4679DRAFT_245770 [Xylaria curta]|nr:hypothetical protein F4679DRAFT_245770 [Xylaria curta]
MSWGVCRAVEHGNIGLVNLLLDKGANASYTIEVVEGSSLLKAVRKGPVDVLAKRTDRVSSTRPLRLAVELRDTAMVKMLLSAGTFCDFKQADGAVPTPLSYSCCFGPGARELQTHDFVNPDLVRLLLKHGLEQ